MGVVFWLFGYISGYVAILALALALAAGLYFVAELAEEFPSTTGKILKYSLAVVTVLQVVLWIDGLPWFECVAELVALVAYASMLQTFPFVQFVSLPTVSSMLLFLATNLFWLRYFIRSEHDMLSIIGYFVIMVWTVPCGLFISLSVNDNTLPGLIGQSSPASNGLSDLSSSGKKKSIFRTVFDYIYENLTILANTFGVLNPLKLLQDKKK